MKRIKTIILSLAFGVLGAMAQNENITVQDDQNGREEVIGLPEGMTVTCDSLINEWMAKKYLFPDTTCVNPDYNPTFTPEEYQERLRRLPVVMEMPYNSVVQKFIDQYSGRLRRTVSYALGAGNFYVPIFEEALDYYGLPLELKYLPVIESALEPKAKSHAGAVGLWQFMLATGKRYDLKVNSLIDERQDPYKSSWAAARYLRDLYKIYRDWSLVIAAYNCGPSNINKAIHRAGGTRDYWAIYPYLPSETRGYVPAFIAANYIMNYYCEHNICPMETELPSKTDTVMVNRDVHFEQVANVLGIDVDQIKQLNPQYRRNIVNGSSKPSALRLPQMLVNDFIDKEDSIYAYNADALLSKRKEVEVNSDAPSYSSRPTRSSYSSSRSSYSSSRSTRSSRKKKNKKERSKNVTIRQGDTLSEIAKRNGTTVKKLKKLNKISGSNIRAGKKLRVK